jgi:hypothetical protein
VEELMVLEGQRVLFGSYDYGRDLVLDLSATELDDLRDTLRGAGLEPARVILAPSEDRGSR